MWRIRRYVDHNAVVSQLSPGGSAALPPPPSLHGSAARPREIDVSQLSGQLRTALGTRLPLKPALWHELVQAVFDQRMIDPL